MTEVLFILTTVFVAYVVYAVVTDQNNTIKTLEKETAHVKEPEKAPAAVVAATAETAVAAVASAEKPKPAARKAAAPAKKAAPGKTAEPSSAQEAHKPGLRNPETGEVATSYSNYRFAKRWIKDALVAEGLVDKVYKTTELDDAAETKIKEAIAKLEAMDKYKV